MYYYTFYLIVNYKLFHTEFKFLRNIYLNHILNYFSSQPIFLNDVTAKCTDNENNQDDTTFFVCYSDADRIHLRATTATERFVLIYLFGFVSVGHIDIH